MAKSAGRTTSETVATAADRSATSLTNGRANVAEHDSARRAYELYLARDREHGHDVGDWLQAERELRETLRSTAA
ncbi:MAG: DUF2934 domain-containing protein [Spirochaetes bacterium]|nr:DUF2934 domain-containing protein [Spirochaetota bacterium]